jgi:RNase P subunit RPR2
LRNNQFLAAATAILLVISLSLASAQAPATNGSIITHSQNRLGSIAATSQDTSGNPCLRPSSIDVSSQIVAPGGTNGSVTGNVAPDVRAHKHPYKNRMSDSTVLQMTLVFKIRNQNQFQNCLESITNSTSSNFGKSLNSTMLQPYLPTPGQKASVVSFLTKHGFTVTDGSSPLVLEVSGSVGSASRVFGVNLGLYAGYKNSTFFSADSDPKLPANLALLVNGIMGLDNYTSIKPAESPCTGPYCPQGIQVGYSFSNLYASGFNGNGVTVAVVDAAGDPNPSSALTTFDSQYGLQAPGSFQVLCGAGNSWTACGPSVSYDPRWASEAAMDIEAVHTVAPGAGIRLFYGTSASDLTDAIDYVASNHLASVVSNSWVYTCALGTCRDSDLGAGFLSSIDSRLATDAAQGLTILFASGDEGARPDGSNLGTEFPASDPNVLAVGATNLALSGSCSPTCSGYGSETGALISGGGYSGFFAEPSWQTSAIGPTPTGYGGHGRAVPDVSMLGYIPGIWVYSTASDHCTRGGNSAGWFDCSGTSLSTPLWAGYMAIVLQIRGGSTVGNIAPRLYQVASTGSYSSDFHDVTSGSNNGYSAGTGWDPVTGWGSPIADALADPLAGAIPITVTSNPTGSGYVTADAGGVTTPQTFSWLIGSTHTLAANSPVGCGAGCQYVFQSWSDGGAQSHTISVSASITTYTANFYQQFMLTTQVSPSGAGTVSVASGSQNAGASVPVTESANAGYSFNYWSLDGSNVGGGPSFSVLMNAAHTLTAVFRGTSTISLSPSSSSISLGNAVTLSGTITPTQPSPGISTGTTVSLSLSTDGGSTWSIFLTTSTTSGGSYSTSWTPPYPGSYKLQASWSGDLNYAGSTSSAASLSVTGSQPLPVQLLVTGPSSASRGSVATFDVFVNETSSNLKTTLERVEILLSLSQEWLKSRPQRAKGCILLARKIGRRYNVRFSTKQKMLFCKKCSTPLLAGYNLTVRLSRPTRALLYICKNCGYAAKFRYGKKKLGKKRE